MGTLEKRAWTELVLMAICGVAATASLAIMVRLDMKGIAYAVLCGAVATIAGFVLYLQNLKAETGLDEREKSIQRRAFTLSAYAFMVSVACVAFVSFFTVGSRGSIPVYVLPAMFFGALCVAQFVQSAAILIQFTKEQVDG